MGMQILQALPNKKGTLCANNQQRKGFPPAKLAGKRSFISRPRTARPAKRESIESKRTNKRAPG
jgi:hypothetical protein